MQTSKFVWATIQAAFATVLIILLYRINADLAREFAASAVAKISLIIFFPIYMILYGPLIALSISALIKSIKAISGTNKIIKVFSILLLIYIILLIIFFIFMGIETISIIKGGG